MSSFFDVFGLREYSRAASMMSVLCVKNFTVAEGSNRLNYIIKNKMAYTEDNVLVYNIFIYSIPKKFTEDDVRRYFTRFGNVLTVRLVTDKKRGRRAAPKVGFVNFAEPTGAYRALLKSRHLLQGQRIGVKAGDSWNQPDAEKVCMKVESDAEASTSQHSYQNVSKAANGEESSEYTAEAPGLASSASNSLTGMNVLALNDDCLEYICGFLKLRDQVHFARVCQRFHNVFRMYCKCEFKNFMLDQIAYMTLWDIRDFFRFAGKNIEQLVGNIPYKNRERIIEFIRTFCQNLKRIILDDSKMRPECLKKLLGSFASLQELHLHDCSLNDYSVQALQHLDKLETLALPENFELTGKFISRLVQLKGLNLYGCSNIQSSYLVEICKSMQHLKTLDIRGCERLSVSLFDAMVEHCKQLEVLKLSCPDLPYERLAMLPRLKQLELLRCSASVGISRMELFVELAKHKAEQLECLKIVAKNTLTAESISLISQLTHLKTLFCASNQSVNDDALRQFRQLRQLEELVIKNCGDITNAGLLSLLRSCKRLRHINVQFCSNLTTEFIFEAIKILQNDSERPKEPMVVLVYGTCITDGELSDSSEYKAAVKASLIKVTFHALTMDIGVDDRVDVNDILEGEGWLDDDDLDDDYLLEEDDFSDEYDTDDDDRHFADEFIARFYPHALDLNFDIW